MIYRMQPGRLTSTTVIERYLTEFFLRNLHIIAETADSLQGGLDTRWVPQSNNSTTDGDWTGLLIPSRRNELQLSWMIQGCYSNCRKLALDLWFRRMRWDLLA